MKYYSPANKQLELFSSPLDELDKSNRWVRLGDELPWTEMEKLYNSRLNNAVVGAGNKPARMVMGAMLVKHKLSLSDEETIQIIRENPYMQYMCGLRAFTAKPIFDPSLFVTIRKRITEEELNAMTVSLMEERDRVKAQRHGDGGDRGGGTPGSGFGSEPESESDPDAAEFVDEEGRVHRGTLKVDATCADAEVRYPVDVDLLDDGCRKLHEYMLEICEAFGLPKPRNYYKDARKAHLLLVKKAKKKGRLVRETIGYLLGCLGRIRRQFLSLVAPDAARYDSLNITQKRVVTATLKMYRQQQQMYEQGVHTCPDRIVSVFQSHVRPIVRGKAGAKTEFGAKIGASVVRGYTFVDHHSWDAYNECRDLEAQILLYRERFGVLPSTVFCDKIYLNSDNRKMLKKYAIRTHCKPLGRPPKAPPSPERLEAEKAAPGKRNEIECSFGTGKRIYRADNIRAKLPETARCWTGMCYFTKNVMKFLRELYIWLELFLRTFFGNCHFPNRRALALLPA